MKTNFLFPNACKPIGFFLFISGVVLGVIIITFQSEPSWLNVRVFTLVNDSILSPKSYFVWIDNNIIDEIIASLLIAGGLMLALSKEKSEDEFIARIRMESLIWAVYVQYGLLFASFWLLYSMAFYWVMLFNLFVLLIFFNIRYYWQMYHYKTQAKNEE